MKTQIIPCTKEEMSLIMQEAEKTDEFDYMIFNVLKTTGRRIGELYGIEEKKTMGVKVVGKKTISINGVLQQVDRTVPIYKKTGQWIYGVKLKDIDFQRGMMKVWVLKRRQYSQDETVLLPETMRIISAYVRKNKINLEDYVFRRKGRSYRNIEKMIGKYAKKAGVQHKVVIHCVSSDTECLTLEGWKKYNELKKGEKIFSYNLKKDCIEIDTIRGLNIQKYDGKMFNINNRYLDCLVSSKHNLPLNISHIKTVNGVKISSVWDGLKLISVEDYLNMKAKRIVLHKLSSNYDGKESIGIYKAGILGWILSDGCISKQGDISVFQSLSSNLEKCRIIEDLFKKSGLRYSIKIGNVKKTNLKESSQLITYRLLGEKKDKEWVYDWIEKDRTPKIKLLLLKKEELKILFDMIMLGDGCRNQEYCSQNIKRIEFIQFLCILLGKRCRLGKGDNNLTKREKYRTWVSNNEFVQILPKHVSEIDYKGVIWCPSTKNKTWIARRNNHAFITGNSFRHYLITELKRSGWTDGDIKKLTGHKSISSLASYDHIVAFDIRDRAIDSIKEI